MELNEITEFRLYVELTRRKEDELTILQSRFGECEQQLISPAEATECGKLKKDMDKVAFEVEKLKDILDKLDDDSEYTYIQDDVNERVDVSRPWRSPNTSTFVIKQVTNYHGFCQLLIELED